MNAWLLLMGVLLAQEGRLIEQSTPPFRIRIPAGYDHKVEELPENGLFAFRRPEPVEGTYYPAVSVVTLGGLIGSEPTSAETLEAMRKRMMPGARIEARRDLWAGRPINVIELYWVQEGRLMMSLAAQVPLKPSAVQVNLFAPLSYEASLRRDLRSMLDSLEGESNVSTRAQVFLGWAAVVAGVGAVLILAAVLMRRRAKAA